MTPANHNGPASSQVGQRAGALRPVPPAPFLPPAPKQSARATSPAASVAGAASDMNAQPHPAAKGLQPASLIASPATPAPGVDANLHRGTFSQVKTNHVRKPIMHNGVTYPSQNALARALGLTAATVSFAIRKGRLDTLGSGSKSGWALANGAPRQPCAAHGWIWPSQKAAAKALNCAEGTVGDNLNRGTFDRLVLQRLGVKA